MAGKFEFRRPGEVRAFGDGDISARSAAGTNPHASTSLKNAAWASGRTTGRSLAANSGDYPTHWRGRPWQPVRTTDGYLTNSTTLGLAANNTFTLALAFDFAESPPGGTLVGIATGLGNVPLVSVAANGAVTITTPATAGVAGFSGTSAAGLIAMNAGIQVLHMTANGPANTVQVWVNGAAVPFTPGWFGTGAFPAPTAWALLGPVGGAASCAARLGLVWFDFGQAITAPAAFWPPRDLGAQLEVPGARPAIGFGGRQLAADWTAGTNLGDGTGTWTRTGTFASAD